MKIDDRDNVVVALTPLAEGEVIVVEGEEITVREDISPGHKIAIRDIVPGNDIIRYGYPIGETKEEITRGEWVHGHNLISGLKGKQEYCYQPVETGRLEKRDRIPAFPAYRRGNGRIGIRNEIWIINTVGCINKTTEKIARRAAEKFVEPLNRGLIDGIYSYSHPYGCSQLGEDLANTQKLLAGLVRHPNAAGVLVVGLGCENNQMSEFREYLGDYDPERIKFLILQEVDDGQQEGMRLLEELVNRAVTLTRQDISLSRLKIGLKCGGSDGFSGITANPLVGEVSDRIIACGGSSILTEVPEMFGAEQILMNRARNGEVFRQIVALINDFKNYFIKHDQGVYENPSPGNRAGGITTLEEKSLGCTEKGGTAQVVDVIKYGEQVKESGLTLLASPGNDLVSATALTAAGAHLVLFTTGRGTPFAPPVPTIKIASNSKLYKKKPHWIDFNAGRLLENVNMNQLSGELFDYIVSVAGKDKLTKNEKHDFRDIAIFKTGVTL